jgi:hypothetical protein
MPACSGIIRPNAGAQPVGAGHSSRLDVQCRLCLPTRISFLPTSVCQVPSSRVLHCNLHPFLPMLSRPLSSSKGALPSQPSACISECRSGSIRLMRTIVNSAASAADKQKSGASSSPTVVPVAYKMSQMQSAGRMTRTQREGRGLRKVQLQAAECIPHAVSAMCMLGACLPRWDVHSCEPWSCATHSRAAVCAHAGVYNSPLTCIPDDLPREPCMHAAPKSWGLCFDGSHSAAIPTPPTPTHAPCCRGTSKHHTCHAEKFILPPLLFIHILACDSAAKKEKDEVSNAVGPPAQAARVWQW